MVKTILDIEGMHCAGCADTLTDRLSKVPGVEQVNVSYAANTAHVHHDQSTKFDELRQAVQDAGYDATLRVIGAKRKRQAEPVPNRIVATILLAIILLLAAMLPMTGLFERSWLSVGIEAVSATLLLIIGANLFSAGIVQAWRNRRANMDTLVVIGVLASFILSVWNLSLGFMQGSLGPTYFEAAGLIIAFVLVGRYLEQRTKVKTANALVTLGEAAPQQARLMKGQKEELVPVSQLKEGDTVKVKPGDLVPADGTIIVGASRIDESLLTGESKAVRKTIRDEVFAGTQNKNGMFMMQVSATGEKTVFHSIVDLVDEAQQSKAPVQRTADRIAAVFVPIVLLIALLAFIGWYLYLGDAQQALLIAVSVLVVACPCALGLATPTAIVAGVGVAARNGVLFKSADEVQRAASVGLVAFDKTGTLTVGEPVVRSVKAYKDLDEASIFRYAASLESASEHPLADAIMSYADSKKVKYGEPRSFEAFPGKGIKGKVEGRKVAVGSLEFFVEEGIGIYDVRLRIPELAEQQLTPVLVALEDKLIGLIGVADAPREDAVTAIKRLEAAGYDTALLTGDNEATAKAVANDLGISVVRAQLSPGQKLSELKKLKKRRPVAFVGDGINDAPALAAADVGIAIGSGADVAVQSAGIALLTAKVEGVPDALFFAKKTMRTVRQNLGWAFGYNIVAIPIAAGLLIPFTGWTLSPALAAALMALSSISVVSNSARLIGTKPS